MSIDFFRNNDHNKNAHTWIIEIEKLTCADIHMKNWDAVFISKEKESKGGKDK